MLNSVLLSDFAQDVRYAWRRLLKRAGFTSTVVTVLALGIGATSAMFSAVDAAMLRPLPFADPNRLVALRNVLFPIDNRFLGRSSAGSATPEPHHVQFGEIQSLPASFSHVAGYAAGAVDVGDVSHPARVRAGLVTPDFFATLGAVPVRGRGFAPEDGLPDAGLTTVLSFGLWQRYFGGQDMIGKNILLSGHSYTVVGVMPNGFTFPQQSDIWIPLTLPLSPSVFAIAGSRPTDVVARLSPGISVAQASQRLMVRWEQDAREGLPAGKSSPFADELADLRVHGAAIPFRQSLVGDSGRALLILLGATGVVLLIACADVTHLLLSEAAGRRREVALRAMLGATRGRIMRQLLTEGVLLSVTGAILGLALAPVTAGLLSHLLPAAVYGLESIQIDTRVLAVTIALGLATGIGLGVWPAVGLIGPGSAETVRSRGTGDYGRSTWRAGLVASALALSVTLVVCAVLLVRSFRELTTVEMGFVPEHVGTLEMAFPLALAKPPGQAATTDSMQDAIPSLNVQRHRVSEMITLVSAVPGITSAAAVDNLPLRPADGRLVGVSLFTDGGSTLPAGSRRFARTAVIAGDYFRTMGIPLIRGRTFSQSDDSIAPHVAIVNRALAEQYWPGTDPIGHRFGLDRRDTTSISIVGVVGNVRDAGLDQDPGPQAYFPVQQWSPLKSASLIARGVIAPSSILRALQTAVHTVSPSQAVYGVQMMADRVGTSVASQRTNTMLLGSFALLAMVLAVLGVYSVVAHSINRRVREFGIRAALGATGDTLVALVAKEMALCIVVGLAIGVIGAWMLSRLLTRYLYGVTSHDLASFVAVPVLLGIAATVATLVPAHRVFRVDPVDAMRAE